MIVQKTFLGTDPGHLGLSQCHLSNAFLVSCPCLFLSDTIHFTCCQSCRLWQRKGEQTGSSYLQMLERGRGQAGAGLELSASSVTATGRPPVFVQPSAAEFNPFQPCQAPTAARHPSCSTQSCPPRLPARTPGGSWVSLALSLHLCPSRISQLHNHPSDQSAFST